MSAEYLAACLGACFLMLASVLGWMGSRLVGRLDAIAESLNAARLEWQREQGALALRVALIEAQTASNRGIP